jgi:hypothetical protein
MLGYLLAVLVMPLLRRLVRWSLILMAAAFAVTVPARLWVRYLNPRPSERTLVACNVVGSALLCAAFLHGVRRRRGCRYRSKRRRAPDR